MSGTTTETLTLAGPPGQPDISYSPNLENYQARTQRRLQTEDLPRTLPDGFPQKLESSLVWDGATVSESYQWSYQLTEADVDEIHRALEHFKGIFPTPYMTMFTLQYLMISDQA